MSLLGCSACTEPLEPGKTLCRRCGAFTVSALAGGLRGVSEKDVVAFSNVEAASIERVSVGGTWDAAWGGGLVPGTCVLLTGTPGGGKSSILQMQSDNYVDVALTKGKDAWAYYLSAEQAAGEVKVALERLRLRHMERILGLREFGAGGEIDEGLFVKRPPCVLVVDSLTAMCGKDVRAAVAVASTYKAYAVKYRIPVFLISHLNKTGDISGAMTLQYNVDGLAAMWPPEDVDPRCYQQTSGRDFRKLEVFKHRSGPTRKAHWFEMSDHGLLDVPADYEANWKKNRRRRVVDGDDDEGPEPVFAADDSADEGPPPPRVARRARPPESIEVGGQRLVRQPRRAAARREVT